MHRLALVLVLLGLPEVLNQLLNLALLEIDDFVLGVDLDLEVFDHLEQLENLLVLVFHHCFHFTVLFR